jgi:D-arabinose 1-dehydrogenase-like Zn-dependent alcohol dehydrogenase
MAGAQNTGGAMQDLNNIVFIPRTTFQYRFWDPSSRMRDDLDGVEIRLREDVDSIEVAKIVSAVLNSTHHGVQDFTVTIPAALLAQQGMSGPVGILVAMATRVVGADVVLLELDEHRRGIAAALGLTVMDPTSPDLAAFIDEWTAGAGADVAFEVSGSAGGVTTATHVLAVRGRLVMVPKSLPRSRNLPPTSSSSSIGNGPLPTRVV